MKSFKTTLVPMTAAILAVIALFAFNRSTNGGEKTTNFNRLETIKNNQTNLEKGMAVLELTNS